MQADPPPVQNDLNTKPLVIVSPQPPFYLSKRFYLFGILLLVIFSLIALAYSKRGSIFPSKVLAKVNGEAINERFLNEKIKSLCLISSSDQKQQALEKWIDFIVLKQEAKKLNIEVTLQDIAKKVDQKGVPYSKICPEEYQQFSLQNLLKAQIMPVSRVDHLVVSKDKLTKLEKLISNYDGNKYPSLILAARTFIPTEKEASAAAYYTFQQEVSPDMPKEGLYQDPKIFEVASSLKVGQNSQILSPSLGSAAGKLVVIRILEKNNVTTFQSFDGWFSEIKKRAKIERFI